MVRYIFLVLISFLTVISFAQSPVFEENTIIISGISKTIKVDNCVNCLIIIDDKVIEFNNESSTFQYTFVTKSNISLKSSTILSAITVDPIPLWLSIIPPLLAIILALVFKEVVTSLVIGIFSGAFIIHLYNDGFWSGLLNAFTSTIDHYLLESLNNPGHLSIILFSMIIGGMVSVISKNGGMQGVVNRISKYAKTAKSGQLATWFLGIAIFFDDYANTLIVGNTMRPVTDKLKISREKLAYLVDSTAAPIAAIAFVTTWIGAELGYIESGINGLVGLNESVYSIFISSLAYSFYPIFALILRERDFGPMYSAEKIARESDVIAFDPTINQSEIEEFNPKEGIPHRAINAILPVLIVIIGTIIGLFATGLESLNWELNSLLSNSEMTFSRKLSSIIGNADSYKALLWSSLSGLVTAIILTVSQRILNLHQAVNSAISGFKTMLSAVIILVLAWSLALVIEELHTADLLTSIMSNNVSPYLVPTITFLLAAMVAFSTGSSWGTMAILYPLMLPASWSICLASGLEPEVTLSIFHNVVASVLAGAVLGDHCSPISDTTILSSLASSCNHISHVKTQMPYALTVGLVAVIIGTLPAAFGISSFLLIPIGTIAIYFIIGFLGKKIPQPS